jgi:large subunit ribosomal protein L10
VNREEKSKIVDDLQERFSKSKVVILTDYKGLDVAKINELRRKLRESDTEFKVVKNTLLIRASENTDVSVIKDSFKGPSAIALNYEDPVAPAKILTEFAKDNKALEIKVGVMNGKEIDLDSIKSLATLPSREVLLGQVLSAMSGVTTGLVRALNDIPARFMNVLQAIREKKEAA